MKYQEAENFHKEFLLPHPGLLDTLYYTASLRDWWNKLEGRELTREEIKNRYGELFLEIWDTWEEIRG